MTKLTKCDNLTDDEEINETIFIKLYIWEVIYNESMPKNDLNAYSSANS
jgi:hypothetical protein